MKTSLSSWGTPIILVLLALHSLVDYSLPWRQVVFTFSSFFLFAQASPPLSLRSQGQLVRKCEDAYRLLSRPYPLALRSDKLTLTHNSYRLLTPKPLTLVNTLTQFKEINSTYSFYSFCFNGRWGLWPATLYACLHEALITISCTLPKWVLKILLISWQQLLRHVNEWQVKMLTEIMISIGSLDKDVPNDTFRICRCQLPRRNKRIFRIFLSSIWLQNAVYSFVEIIIFLCWWITLKRKMCI